MNLVDVSPETVAAEWASIEADEGLASVQEPAQGKTPGVSESPPPIPDSQLAGRVAGALKTGFRYGFKYLAPAWNVTKDECSRLGDAWAKVAVKYLPASWFAWLPATDGGESSCIECDALAITAEVVVPRLQKTAQVEPVESEKQEAQAGSVPAALQGEE